MHPESSGSPWSNEMGDAFGPEAVDQMVRLAIHACSIALPPERRNPAEVERQFLRILHRALRDHREDVEAFGRLR